MNDCDISNFFLVQTDCNYKQHLQGIINHGRDITLYRTFNNIYNGANLSIHTWLKSLQKTYDSEGGKLPDTVFAQIDGGSENANVTVKGVCELLVSRRLTRKVVLTRLPVGHTHEDIDAIFGKIWKFIDGEAVFTPQGYERALRFAMKQRDVDIHIDDILCVPDYTTYMEPFIDSKLNRCDKQDWTELQWTFEAVDHCAVGCACEKCKLYPTGVKVNYRKYTADEVILVREDQEHTYGFDFAKYKTHTHPLPEKEGDPDGMYLLTSLPHGTREFIPQPFKQGSRKELETLVRKMNKQFGRTPGVTKEWEHWRDNVAPQSDDANEYCQLVPLAIPFWDELFSGSPVNTERCISAHVPKPRQDGPPQYETTNSVV